MCTCTLHVGRGLLPTALSTPPCVRSTVVTFHSNVSALPSGPCHLTFCQAVRRASRSSFHLMASSQASNSSTSTASSTGRQHISVTLRGTDVLQCVQLDIVPQERGQVIVVVGVMEGSSAEQAGVRPGQRLVALSDPLRYGTMWQLQDRPSLRFVTDTLKMRRSQAIDLELEEFMSDAEYEAFLRSKSELSEEEDGATIMGLNIRATQEDSDGYSSGADSSSDTPGLRLPGGQSIGDKLAQQYAEAERGRQAVSDVQKRMSRRKEYMEDVSQRNDSGFSLVLLSFFVLPPLVILVVASSTGYLDHLFELSLTLR